MIEKVMLISTERHHDANKTLRIRASFEPPGSKRSDHPFDTEVPELDAHQMAAVESVKAFGPANFEIVGYCEWEPGSFTFVVKELK